MLKVLYISIFVCVCSPALIYSSELPSTSDEISIEAAEEFLEEFESSQSRSRFKSQVLRTCLTLGVCSTTLVSGGLSTWPNTQLLIFFRIFMEPVVALPLTAVLGFLAGGSLYYIWLTNKKEQTWKDLKEKIESSHNSSATIQELSELNKALLSGDLSEFANKQDLEFPFQAFIRISYRKNCERLLKSLSP